MKQSLRNCFTVVLFAVVCLMISAHSAGAMGLEHYQMEMAINDDTSVDNVIAIKFENPVYHLDYEFDFNIYDLNTTGNIDSISCNIINNGRYSDVSCDFVGMTKEKNLLVMKFKTKNAIKRVDNKYQLVMNYPVSLDIKKAFVIIKLPENGVLAGEDVNQSYSPRDGKIVSDGKKIMVYWEMNNLSAGETMQFSVIYDMPITEGPLFNVIVISLTSIIMLVMVGLTFYLKKSGVKAVRETADIVSSVLNDDEKKSIEIVKQNGGEVIQRVIVRETGFSKAKVSRIVKNLKERNILEVIPLGRTNKVKLKIEIEKKETPAEEENKNQQS